MAALTTHQAAGRLGVSLPTVVNWIKQGRLEAYKTPGGHRRIPEEALNQFCEQFGIPGSANLEINVETKQGAVLLLSSYELDFAELIQDFMRIQTESPIEIVYSALACGISLAKAQRGVLLIDQLHSNVDPMEALEVAPSEFAIVVLTETTEEAARLVGEGFYKVLSRPLVLEELLKTLNVALDTFTA
jgi:excisionase family DNA binding protein